MGRKQVIGVILLSGCACPELTAVPIEDPDGLMAEGQADGIRDALADFAAWTGGPAVCFPSVRITADEDLEGALGRWDGAGRPMRLAGNHPRAYATVVHELCHAWDEGVGHESDWHPTIFPEESVRDRQTYDAPVLRVREAFARVCEGGPADLRLREDLADRCGIQTSDEGERWVAREVYGVALPEPVVAPLDLVRTPLDAALGGLRVLDAVSGGGRVWLLGMRARPFHPLQPLRVYHVLLGLDARSGAVETRLMLRRRPESRRRFRLVGGEPAPLLVEDGPDGMLLSALGPDGRPDTLLRLEPGMLQWDGAARVGSEVWMTGVDAVAEDGLSVLDLVSGALGPAALDPPLPAWRTVFGQVS
ncbi:MAG: hypothetical protein VX000_13560, partial [Myxococcota bacterium]|nr:hypothetical protein [Myxococcota bacterium]